MAKKGFSIPPSIKTFFKKRGVLVALALLVVCVLWMISRSSKHETADEYHYREALDKKGKCHRGWEPAGKTKDGKRRCRRKKDATSVYGNAKWKSSGSLTGDCKNIRENLYRGYKDGSFNLDQFQKWSGYGKIFNNESFKVCDCFDSSTDCGLTQEQKDQIVDMTNDVTSAINDKYGKKTCNPYVLGEDVAATRDKTGWKTVWTKRTQIDDGSWKCLGGYTDTGCSWGDGENEQKQCAMRKESSKTKPKCGPRQTPALHNCSA